MLESVTEPVSSFASAHPALIQGLVLGGVVLAGLVASRFWLQKLGVID